jgi:uncharacterized OsmC-like protein
MMQARRRTVSEDTITTRVTSRSIGQPGRSLNTARNNHFVIDSPTIGEALTSGEAFLSGVSSCGVTLIENHAHRNGVPLMGLRVTIDGVRATSDPTRFQSVAMRFEMDGVSQQQADELLAAYTST